MNIWWFLWCNTDLNLSLEILSPPTIFELCSVFVIITLFSLVGAWFNCNWLKGSFHTLSQLGHTLCNNLNLEETGKILIVDCMNPHIFSLHVHYALVIFLQVWQPRNKPVTRQSKHESSCSVPVNSQTLLHWHNLMFEEFICVSVLKCTDMQLLMLSHVGFGSLTHTQLQ